MDNKLLNIYLGDSDSCSFIMHYQLTNIATTSPNEPKSPLMTMHQKIRNYRMFRLDIAIKYKSSVNFMLVLVSDFSRLMYSKSQNLTRNLHWFSVYFVMGRRRAS
jgi:hypothetical protein